MGEGECYCAGIFSQQFLWGQHFDPNKGSKLKNNDENRAILMEALGGTKCKNLEFEGKKYKFMVKLGNKKEPMYKAGDKAIIFGTGSYNGTTVHVFIMLNGATRSPVRCKELLPQLLASI